MNLARRLIKNRNRILLLLLIILVGVYFFQKNAYKKTASVKTATVEKGKVSEELVLSGEIKAEEDAKMNFLTTGEIYSINVKEGDFVKKGQVLVKLDSTNAYQTYLQAEADLRRYQAALNETYDDLQGHAKDESFSQITTRTAAETNKDKAYRSLVIAQKNLSTLSLKAPFDGMVTSITHPFPGINTSLMESQIQVVNPATLYFSVSADQTEVTKLKVGQKVNIVMDSFPDENLKGEVTYISYTPVTGETGAIYGVKVMILSDNGPSSIRIGMTGDAKFILSEKEGVLSVPTTFVNSDTKGKYVFTDNQKKNRKYVEIGAEGEDKIEIKSGLNEGEVIYD